MTVHFDEKPTWAIGDVNRNIAYPYQLIPSAFSTTEADQIVHQLLPHGYVDGLVGKPTADGGYEYAIDNKLRLCDVIYFQRTDIVSWFLDRVESSMVTANNDIWQFDVREFFEHPRMMSYSAGQHFNSWHMDAGPGDSRFRKLTSIVMLTEPNEYEGGEFHLSCYGHIPLNKGDMLIFPAFAMHRVAPVTSGNRKTLVHRCMGPRFA